VYYPVSGETLESLFIMARTKVSVDTTEKIATRLAMLSQNESKSAQEKVKAIYWTLGAVGYSEDAITAITTRAEEIAEDFNEDE
jgi:hypothetical protein